jgi:hypothetical protein
MRNGLRWPSRRETASGLVASPESTNSSDRGQRAVFAGPVLVGVSALSKWQMILPMLSPCVYFNRGQNATTEIQRDCCSNVGSAAGRRD